MNSTRNLTTNRKLRLAQLEQENGAQPKIAELGYLTQENERLKAELNERGAQIKELERLTDTLNGDIEESALRPNPNITIIKHSAPTIKQPRYFAGIGKRLATKEFKQRFSNMTLSRSKGIIR
jgi:hypothetical protein